MNPKDQLIQKARRIAELAARGEGGERLNAERMLQEYLKKNDLSIDDLDDNQPRDYRFDAPKDHLNMLAMVQCITSTVDTEVFTLTRPRSRTVSQLEARMTPLQHAEACMKMNVMLPLFEKEQRTFFHAFLFANQLLGLGKPKRSLTEDEILHLRRAKSMSMFVKRGEIQRALDPASDPIVQPE